MAAAAYSQEYFAEYGTTIAEQDQDNVRNPATNS
jgi:hypothetical protein